MRSAPPPFLLLWISDSSNTFPLAEVSESHVLWLLTKTAQGARLWMATLCFQNPFQQRSYTAHFRFCAFSSCFKSPDLSFLPYGFIGCGIPPFLKLTPPLRRVTNLPRFAWDLPSFGTETPMSWELPLFQQSQMAGHLNLTFSHIFFCIIRKLSPLPKNHSTFCLAHLPLSHRSHGVPAKTLHLQP